MQHISMVSRNLIRVARSDLDSRLCQASDMLKNFLDDELSDAHLGIPAGTRAHLERFRTFLMSFYSTQQGYYPPQSFDSDMYRSMREDFESLYELLVDNGCTSDVMPSVAVGGICTIQLVQ